MTEVFIHPGWGITPYGQERGFTFDMLGEIPFFLLLLDPRPAAEQINAAYQHGGGWRPIRAPGFRMELDEAGRPVIRYPGDPALDALAETYLPMTGERVFFYIASLVLVLQTTGEFEVARLD